MVLMQKNVMLTSDDQNAHECGEHFCGRAGVLIEHDVVHLLVPLDRIRGLFAAVRALLLLLSCCLVDPLFDRIGSAGGHCNAVF
jgi:hypothetical protein